MEIKISASYVGIEEKAANPGLWARQPGLWASGEKTNRWSTVYAGWIPKKIPAGTSAGPVIYVRNPQITNLNL